MSAPRIMVGLVRYAGTPGMFEVLLINETTGEEVTLRGVTDLKVEELDKVCPTSVMIETGPAMVRSKDDHTPTQWAYDTLALLKECQRSIIEVYRDTLEKISRHEDIYAGFGSVIDKPVYSAEEASRMATKALQDGNALIIKHREFVKGRNNE